MKRSELPSLPSSKMPNVGTTIFTEMSALAKTCGALNMAQGFPDLATPKDLRNAAREAMENGHNQYAPMAGNAALRGWIAHSYHQGMGYDPEDEITIGAGASSVLFAAMTALLRAGDEVVVQDPCYDLYAPVAELQHARVVKVPLVNDRGEMNANGLASAINHRTRLVILNSPHNPTGMVTTEVVLDTLAVAMEGTSAWLISDEVYGPMVHDGRPDPRPSNHPKLRGRTLVAGSFGKLFHATGWKIGWMAAPKAITTELRKVHQYDVFSTGAPFQQALVTYLETDEARAHLDTVGPIYEEKRDRLLAGLTDTALTWTPAEGGYFQVVDVSEYLLEGENDHDLARRWTRDHGLATIPMSAFSKRCKPSVRICFAKEDATIDKALSLLQRIPIPEGQDSLIAQNSGPTENSLGDVTESLRVVALQMDLQWHDPSANLAAIANELARLDVASNADVVVVPEMFTTGFTMDPSMPEELDPEGKGATSEWMLAQAKHHDVALAGSVAVRDHEGRAWNRFWWATPEGTLVSYDKRHLFTLAKEAAHYEAGDARIEVEWRGWTFLLQTCYDLRFPGFARNHQHPPYDVAIYVANWPEKRREAWRTLLQARAIENQCFVVGVNRVGVDGSGHRYAGDSMVVDMAGACLADADGDGQAKTIEATLGREKLRAFRKALPFLEDADRFGIFI